MLAWRKVDREIPCGVIVASDQSQEWMLPWWWDNYVRYNDLPVTFVDLGLSDKLKAFCEDKGELVSIPSFPAVGQQQAVSQERAEFWETIYESRTWWHKRLFFHKKPMALLQTPYQHTLWLDTDCEVHDTLLPLFKKMQEQDALLICPEIEEAQVFEKKVGHIFSDEVLFNSGVIGFSRGSRYIMEWAEETIMNHGSYVGDQNVLSRLIYERKWPVHILDRLYNWRQILDGKHPDMKITHWVGEAGKFFISLKQAQCL